MNPLSQQDVRPRRDAERGSVILVVMLIAALLILLGASMSYLVGQGAHMSTMLRRRAQAHALAEAGISHAFSVLAEDFGRVVSPFNFPETALGPGTFDAEVSLVGNDRARIVSTGIVESVVEVVEVDVSAPNGWLPEQVMFANSYMRLRGDGDAFGSTHSNSYTDMGGTVWIGEHATASGDMRVGGQAVVEGNTVGDWPMIRFPVLNFDIYHQLACEGGVVYEGDQTFSDTTLQPGNGIVWVNGDVTFTSHNHINGCVVATGDIKQSGHLTNSLVTVGDSELPVLMSRDGSILIGGQTDINGLIYSLTGDVDLRGGSDSYIYGKIFAGANVIGRGNWGACRNRPIKPFALLSGCMRIMGWKR